MNLIRYILVSLTLPVIFLTGVEAQVTSTTVRELHNCEDFKLPEFDDLMTRQEKVEILDSLLNDILNRTGDCERVASSSSSSDSGGSVGGNGGGQLRGVSQSGDTLNEESQSNEEPSAVLHSEQATIDSEPPDNSESPKSKPMIQTVPSGSGQVPEDIPPVDSDDVIARQLRKAAEAEADADKRAKLWDKYRKYKNLPPQAGSQTL
ncbi:MAG: hypothetical protein OXE56_08110 [Gammaproteobacteria bacterium]|nr:hypothetical protein [Gammaproteobacteria bacterium]